jgi:hypothetical protein
VSCFHPLTAFRTSGGAITFVRARSASKVSFQLPCGRCIGCRLEYSRQWAMRCLHEAKMSSVSSFLTLTYDNEFLPPAGTLVLRDLQLFMKRLRKRKGDGIRFYASGEYGDDNLRPHYHLLLFNCSFDDRVFLRKNSRDENLYTSKECSGLWPYGFNVIGDVTFDSAAYVARYVLKKVNGKQREAGHYEVYDEDGLIHERLPEFAVMSRRPGIGSGYYAKYGSEIRAHDSVVIDGREVRPPRFYDARTEQYSDALSHYVGRERKRESVSKRDDNTPERLRVKEEIAKRSLDMKKRVL